MSVSLANHGVRFLDELVEFPVLDSYASRSKQGVVRVNREKATVAFVERVTPPGHPKN